MQQISSGICLANSGHWRTAAIGRYGDLWRIPGQSSLDELPPEIGVDYAVQVVRSLPELSPEHLKARCYRPGKGSFGSNLGDWPTPLRIFLADCAWLPVARGLVGGARFVCPRDAWLFHTEDEVPPRFMELVLGPVAKLFDDPSVELLRSLGGLGVLTDERDKFQALTAYADAASLGLSDVRDVKRFRELFGGLWTRAVPSNDSISLAHIPVAIGTEIRAIATAQVDPLMEASVEPAYIVDEDMRLEYRPISFEIQHRRQLKAYLTEQFDRLMDLLRTSFVDRFDRTESLSEYARIGSRKVAKGSLMR